MFRLFSMLLAATGALAAQCLPPAGGAAVAFANPDEALSAVLPLNLAFPMAGASGAPFTHCVVSTNGVLYLTNGGPAVGAGTFDWGGIASLRGAPGASPRIAPYWNDLWDAVPGTWQVTIDTSVADRCAVLWTDVAEWDQHQPAKSFAAELFATGEIRFTWSLTAIDRNPTTIGVSLGNAIADPGPVDLSVATSSSTGILYQIVAPGPFALGGRQITITPNGLGGYGVAPSCLPAEHARVGTGCYAISDSAYQVFADAGAASAALPGKSLTFVPAGASYAVQWGSSGFQAASAPVPLALGDDDELVYTPSHPLPGPFGPTSDLRICANGVIGLGATPMTFPGTTSAQPAVSGCLGNHDAAFYAWHDFDPTEFGSGAITLEEKPVAGDIVVVVTWDGVENRPTGVSNPSSLQFQLNLTTGVVTIVWEVVDANPSSASGSAHLIGFSPAGPSQDAGAVDFPAVSPLVLQLANQAPLSLSASPAPISTAAAGTTVLYTVDDLPEFAPGAGVRIGLIALSLAASAGVPLPVLGIDSPGCFLQVGGLDLLVAVVGAQAAQVAAFSLPAGLPPGLELFAQGIGLVTPNSLPNGLPGSGLVTSNGLVSRIGAY